MRSLFFVAAAGLAFQSGAALAADEALGKVAYEQYCVACHGEMAAGAGELADLMSVEVPDLTKLAANNDGQFPMLEVIHVIDGRTGLRGHGGPMPTYGALFDVESGSSGPYGAPLYTRGKILSIAYYLESVQR